MADNILMKKVDAVMKRIQKLRQENALVFVLFSDLHTNDAAAEPTQTLLRAFTVLCERVAPDAVIDLGDNLAMLGRNRHISNQELSETLTQLFDSIHRAAKCPLFLINGNHDGIGTDFFKPALWNSVVKGKYDDGLAHYHSSGSYFYVDYAQAKTRLVFLSVPHESDMEAVNPRPLWSFGTEQLQWLQNDALNTDQAVLLFTHVPFFYRYRDNMTDMLEVWDGEKTRQSYISQLCGWIDDCGQAAAIIKASGKAVACFSGHTHEDSLWAPYETRNEDINLLPCPQIVTKKPVTPSGSEDGLGICLDILIWDPDQKEMQIIRFGDGEDRFVKV